MEGVKRGQCECSREKWRREMTRTGSSGCGRVGEKVIGRCEKTHLA